ncbi:MAG TPA: tripartite tricarboxylate transporter substrate binding protein [Xanthobacteraceae bacterium]|jgi:tripartite-type tricarboxylate transporter receptor subunit TctC
MRSRRRASALAAVVAAVFAASVSASAQTYPARPVRMVVAFSAGGTIDALARILAQKLSERWGQSVLVDNRGGAAGNLGAMAAAQALADGYTIHLGAQSLATNVTMAPLPNFDPRRDFDPVMAVATAQDVLMVPPDAAARSLPEWIAYAKARPGELNYASLGTGSSGHLATVLFAQVTGLKLEHVPYTGVSQAVTDIVAGRISVWLATLGGHLGNIQSGRVRALAVSGEGRAPSLPEVPTFTEQGIAVEESTWFGVFVPRGTPKPIIARLNHDLEQVLAEPAMQERAAQLGFRLIGGAPDKLAGLLQSEIAKWAEVAKSAGLVAR